MIGLFGVALLAVSPMQETAAAENMRLVRSFVSAFLAGNRIDTLPGADPKVEFLVQSARLRPDIDGSPDSIRKALNACTPMTLRGGSEFDGEFPHLVSFDCPGDKVDAAKRLSLIVVVKNDRVSYASLQIGHGIMVQERRPEGG